MTAYFIKENTEFRTVSMCKQKLETVYGDMNLIETLPDNIRIQKNCQIADLLPLLKKRKIIDKLPPLSIGDEIIISVGLELYVKIKIEKAF